MKIPADELRRAEEKCNALIELQEDYHHHLRFLEQTYGAKITARIVRTIVGGGAGSEHVLLEEDIPQNG